MTRNLIVSARSLFEQRQRAALSALGVMVGATAIVLLVSIAKGVQEDLKKEVGDLGVNLLIVIPGRIEESSMFNPGLLGISYLEEQDVARIVRVPGVRRAVPMSFVGGGVHYGQRLVTTSLVVATEPGWFVIRNTTFAEGRGIERRDDQSQVCVLGEVAKKKLFDDAPALGKAIVYNGKPYKVVGVTRQRPESSSMLSEGGFENFIYLSYRYIKKSQPDAQINRILIQTEPDREPKSLVSAVEAALGERLQKETYSVLTQEDLLKLVFKLMGILTWLLVGLTSIALFVGGVGIMTVMLMSVQERTKEIGIRKAFGARRSDIFTQFFFEALLVALLGGACGLMLSGFACWGLSQWTLLKPMVTPTIIALSLGVSIGVGCVFGLIPAMRAARRDPVGSLRYE